MVVMKPLLTCLHYMLFLALVNPTFENILIFSDGNYSLGPEDNDYWLNSGPIFLHSQGQKLDTDNGTLKVWPASFGSSGIDKLGRWQDLTNKLTAPDNQTMVVGIKTYPLDEPNIIIFSQNFPEGLKSCRAANANYTVSGYPTFRLNANITNTSLAYLMFAGYMLGDTEKTYGRWTPPLAAIRGGLDGSGPFVLFDQNGGVLIISTMDHSMAASVWLDGDVLAWGVMGGVDYLPPGFTLQTLVYLGNNGVGQAFQEWGRILREWYDKTDDVVEYHQLQDITLTHLGYWTDNGAYYYYHTEQNKSYEQTLLDVVTYASQEKIPYRYVQLDSWWYPKDNTGAVTTWDSMPQIFPHGLRNLSAALRLPIAAHNRYWSVNTPYAKQNGGQFNFFIGQQLSLPMDQEFWDWLLKTSSEWGLRLYEQDWLNIQTLRTEILQTNLTAGEFWLDSMARAARNHNMTVQYCMSQSRHALHSLRWPEITQARVTDDYHLYEFNWKIGITSHLAAALGLAPSKDTFWTSSMQPGNPFNKTEPFPVLQSVVATLSMGPVGPGDAINLTDKDALMRCCAADGLILKPSRPATAIDAMFMEMGFGEGEGTSGEVWSTYSDLFGKWRFGIVFTANVSRAFNITPTAVGLNQLFPEIKSRLFSRNFPEKLYNFSDTEPFDIGPNACNSSLAPYFCLFYTSPLIEYRGKELLVLGELEKWVPMSPRRVLHYHQAAENASAFILRGEPGEKIVFSYVFDQQLYNVSATADNAGCAHVIIDPPSPPLTTVSVTTANMTTTAANLTTTSVTTANMTTTAANLTTTSVTTANMTTTAANLTTASVTIANMTTTAANLTTNAIVTTATDESTTAASSSVTRTTRDATTIVSNTWSTEEASTKQQSATSVQESDYVRLVQSRGTEGSCHFVPPFTPLPSSTTPTTTSSTSSTPTTSRHSTSTNTASRQRMTLSAMLVLLSGYLEFVK